MTIISILLFASMQTQTKQLTWNDFTPVKKLEDASALSTLEISYSYLEDQAGVKIKVYCTFNKKQSYVVAGKQSKKLLAHEQLHYDIAYHCSVMFMNRINNEPAITQQRAEEIYNEIIAYWNNLDTQYDFETNHSTIEENQLIWEQKKL